MAIFALEKSRGSPPMYNHLTCDLYWRIHVSHDMDTLFSIGFVMPYDARAASFERFCISYIRVTEAELNKLSDNVLKISIEQGFIW